LEVSTSKFEASPSFLSGTTWSGVLLTGTPAPEPRVSCGAVAAKAMR